MNDRLHIESISELLALLPSHKIEHPLVGLVNFDDYEGTFAPGTRISLGFYTIMLADGCQHKLWYGQRPYDFSAGNMLCIAS